MIEQRLVDDPELVRKVRDLRESGATYAQIKAELKVDSSTVSRILGTAGAGRRPRIPADIRERARALRVDGRSVPDIARELGLARSTAWLITKDIERGGGGARSTTAGRSAAECRAAEGLWFGIADAAQRWVSAVDSELAAESR